MDTEDIKRIQKLVGNIKKEQLAHVDSVIGENMGLFLPITGQCGFAVKKNHSHPSYSFILCPNSIKISGIEIKKETGHDVLVGMSPGFEHHEDVVDDFVRYFAICIDSEYFESNFAYYETEIPYFSNTVFEVTTDLIPILKSYITEYRDKLPGYKRQMVILEERIVHLIIRNCLNVRSSMESTSHRFEVESAIEFIHANYMKKISVDNISNAVNYSTSSFSRIFKKEMGKTLSSYIIETRLEKSKKLMEVGKLNLTDVAYSCGFNSPSHFSSAFKKSYGASPSEYQSFVGRRAEF